jgi:DNA recombination protein RmuC
MLVVIVFGCLLAGALLGWFAARAQSALEVGRLQASLQARDEGESRLAGSLRALSQQAARDQQMAMAQVIHPLQDTLYRYEQRLNELEHHRVDAYAQLRTEVHQMTEVSSGLRVQTGQLVAALRAPQVRGRWGEHQLRRIVEAAGLLEHCDFNEQVSARTDDGGVRPDLVVHLYGGRHVVVDAKAPFDAYLTAMELRDDRSRGEQLRQHAKALRSHIDTLASKAYWDAFTQTPEFVVLFVPADPFLDAALQHDPTLLEHAFSRNIVLATPATLVALLRTIAYAWRQETLARNAITVHALGKELYSRLSTMGEHLAKVGTGLSGAVASYNKAIGSLETRVLVSARKLAELGISAEELATPAQVEVAPRQVAEVTVDTLVIGH